MVDYHNIHPHVSERNFWIEVSDSQLKIKPHPRDRDADAFLRTFDVLQVSGECSEGHLNMQLITILEDRGVPREVLAEALSADLESYSGSLNEAMKSGLALRLWLHEHESGPGSDSQKLLGAFPIQKRDQLIRFLECGFAPRDSAKLISCVTTILSIHMTDYCLRFRIKIPCSTVVYCVPDPCGILAEDEVCINFTSPVRNPETGLDEMMLDGLNVLVARNPAHLASDIQLRKAVYRHELRQCRDVIIFPTKGPQALASMLSGGDYDGDKVMVIWDLDMVKNFRNAELPQLPHQHECGMTQISQPLSELFGRSPTQPTSEGIQTLVQKSIDFNTRPNLLGECSTEHEKLVYTLSRQGVVNKLATSGPVKLAALAGYLVDSSKQGWSLDRASWNLIRRQASGPNRLGQPAYKEGKAPKAHKGRQNVIDYLFGVAQKESDKVLRDFKLSTEHVGTYDGVLSQCWHRANEQADQEAKVLTDPRHGQASTDPKTHDTGTMKDVLKALSSDLKQLRRRCDMLFPGGDKEGSGRDPQKSKKYRDAVQTIHEEYQAIEPRFNHWLRRQFEAERNDHSPYWARIRASCLYYSIYSKGQTSAWVWYVAGPDLCELKASSLGREGNSRLLLGSMYNILKVNSKLARAIVERGGVMNKLGANGFDEDEIDETGVAGDADS